MEIYKIEDHKKNKKLVYLEEDTPAFSLYSKEIKQFDLKAGEELTPEKYDEILEILSKRARERCLYLLDDMARTEQQLRKKLAEGFYPEEAADYAIAYCKDKHYIDDEEYARRYIELKTGTLSKKMIEQKLYSRGIGKDITENAFEETGFTEDEAIRSLIRKKIGEVGTYDHEERQKVIRKLMSKGFSYDSIRRVLDDTGIC